MDSVRASLALGRPVLARWGATAVIALAALAAAALAWPPPPVGQWTPAPGYGIGDPAPLPGRAPSADWGRMPDAVALLSSRLGAAREVGSAPASDFGTWPWSAGGPVLEWTPGARIPGVPGGAPRAQVYVPLGAFVRTGSPTVYVEYGPLGSSTVVTLEVDPAAVQQALDWVYPVEAASP